MTSSLFAGLLVWMDGQMTMFSYQNCLQPVQIKLKKKCYKYNFLFCEWKLFAGSEDSVGKMEIREENFTLSSFIASVARL